MSYKVEGDMYLYNSTTLCLFIYSNLIVNGIKKNQSECRKRNKSIYQECATSSTVETKPMRINRGTSDSLNRHG